MVERSRRTGRRRPVVASERLAGSSAAAAAGKRFLSDESSLAATEAVRGRESNDKKIIEKGQRRYNF
jgi:hypothetical protein